MELKSEEFTAFVQELRNLLGGIKGVKNISETFSLSYVCVVGSEEEKEPVEKVGNFLTEQATRYGIDLEVCAATEEEVKKAREELVQMQLKEKGSFEV